MSVVEPFRIRKVGVKDTPTEKAMAKIMVNRGKEQELDLSDIPSAQPVRENSSQDQELVSSYEDELLREDSSPDVQGDETQQDQDTESATTRNLLGCLPGFASISMAAHIQHAFSEQICPGWRLSSFLKDSHPLQSPSDSSMQGIEALCKFCSTDLLGRCRSRSSSGRQDDEMQVT